MSDPDAAKVVRVYRWNILRSQIRHQGLLLWLLRKSRRPKGKRY
jgi:hypothetical protein